MTDYMSREDYRERMLYESKLSELYKRRMARIIQVLPLLRVRMDGDIK